MKITVEALRLAILEEMKRRLFLEYVNEAKLGLAKPGMKKPPGEDEEDDESPEKELNELRSLIEELLYEIDVRKAQVLVNTVKSEIDQLSIHDIGALGNPMKSATIEQLIVKIQDVDQYGPSGPKVAQALLKYLERHVDKLAKFMSASDRGARGARAPVSGRRGPAPMPTAKRHAMRRSAA